MASWYYPNCPGSNFTPQYLASPVQKDPQNIWDGYNTIGWAGLDPGVLAVTTYRALLLWWQESDIAVSANVTWALDENSADPIPPYINFNFEGVVRHEMGHVTGLHPHEDRTPRVALMNSQYSFGSEEDWWMHGDDRNGLRTLYSGSGTEVDVQLIGWKKTTNSSYEPSVPVNAPTPTSVYVGNNVTVEFTLENLGTQSHNNVQMGVYLSENVIISTSDVLIGSGYFNFQPANGGNNNVPILTWQWTVTIPTVPSGTYYLGGIVDYNNALSETREYNNAIVFPYPQNPQPITVICPSPAAPSWCTASDNNCGYIMVNWENVANESGYRVYRDGSEVGTTGANVTSYQDNVTGTHSYKVKAYNTCGNSGDSPADNGTGWTLPAAPSGCVASDDRCDDVRVCWNDNSTNEDGFKIYRNGSLIATVGANTNCYNDNTAVVWTTYSYYVKAYNTPCGESGQSNSDNGTRIGIPAVPSGLSSTSYSGQIRICWGDVNGETGYKIYRDENYLSSVSANIICYDDLAPLIGKHNYKVSASNVCGESGRSTPVYDSMYFVGGNVTDDQGDTLVAAMVFVISRLPKGMPTSPLIVDTAFTNSLGDYHFILPSGLYSVFRDSTVYTHNISLPGDAANDSVLGLNFRGLTDVEEASDEAKLLSYSLSQNYPNPFNPQTIIEYQIPKDSWVTLEIYNILGQKIRQLFDGHMEKGHHRVTWDGKDDNGTDVANGIYFYRIKAGEFSDVKKMVLLK